MPSTRIDRIDGVSTSTAVKSPVKAATTANITLSGLQTIDGVSCVADDRVFVRAQTTASENGIYDVSATGWSRAKDFDGARDVVQGTQIPIVQGTLYAGQTFRITTANTITIGTSNITSEIVSYLSEVDVNLLVEDTNPDGAADFLLTYDTSASANKKSLIDTVLQKFTTGFIDSAFKIIGSADATKKVAFEVDGLTTGTTRTLTVQDASGTIALSADITAAVGSAFQSIRVREFTATGAGTYTPTANTVAFIAEWVGAGGGGGARVTNNGTDGGTTTFDSIVANGGEGGRLGGDGAVSRGGVGGTGGTGTADSRVPGGGGHLATGPSSAGGDNPLFPSSGSTTAPAGNAVAGNYGCGGGGGNSNSGSTYSGGGGGGGEYCGKAYYGTIAASHSYNIGTGGAGGAAGTIAGGTGGNGYIRITEFIKA